MTATVLEVWGDPIAHSLSPALHAAAYAHLGWEWTYGRRRVDEASFAAELAGLDTRYRGLSCTFPLKASAFAAATDHDERALLTGAVNTLLLTGPEPRGFNTDVGGIVRALAETGVDAGDHVRVIGAGATATSALVALAETGVRRVDVVARRPEAVEPLITLGRRLGVAVHAEPLTASVHPPVALTVSTLPGDAPLAPEAARSLAAAGGLLFDVVYGHWPTALARAWDAAGHPSVSGEGMLLHQAVLQIRLFSTGDIDTSLPDEATVVDVMRRALVGG